MLTKTLQKTDVTTTPRPRSGRGSSLSLAVYGLLYERTCSPCHMTHRLYRVDIFKYLVVASPDILNKQGVVSSVT